MQIGRSGPTCSTRKAAFQVRRALTRHTGQLAEIALAKAIQGDSTALLACAVLWASARQEEPK